MPEVNLLRSLPKSARNITARETAKTAERIRTASEFGRDYFDGPREYGYGGYRYDGRWKPVARDIVAHFGLKPGDRVLDIGCAKGFLVKDLLSIGIDAYGVDVSEYALRNCEPEVVGRLHLGNAERLPFPEGSFSAALAINSLHNLPRSQCRTALAEMERIAFGMGFVQVDSYRTPEEKVMFERWVLTAKCHDYPDGWLQLFREAGYSGDWFWTIIG